MLPRLHKLSRVTFPHRKDPRHSWVGKTLRVEAYPSSSILGRPGGGRRKSTTPCFAVVVAKRLSDTVVMRNTFKRQVMAVIQENVPYMKRLSFSKYVILPTKHLHEITRTEIVADMDMFLKARRLS